MTAYRDLHQQTNVVIVSHDLSHVTQQ